MRTTSLRKIQRFSSGPLGVELGFSLRYGAYVWELVQNNPKALVYPFTGPFHPKSAHHQPCTAQGSEEGTHECSSRVELSPLFHTSLHTVRAWDTVQPGDRRSPCLQSPLFAWFASGSCLECLFPASVVVWGA